MEKRPRTTKNTRQRNRTTGKRATLEQRTTQARLQRLYESDIIGIAVTELTGGIVEANDAFLRITGQGRQALREGTLRWDTITPREWRASDQRAVRQLRKTGVAPQWEKEYLRPDGSLVPVVLGAALLDGSREQAIIFCLDNSPRRKAEQALAQSEAKLRRLWESNVIGMGISTTDGRILDANDEYLRILGQARPVLTTGKLSWQELTPPEWEEAERRAAEQVARMGVANEYEKEYMRPDGTRVRVLLGLALLEGSRTNCIMFCLDLTRRQRAEEALAQLNRELEQRVAERTALLAESEARTAEAHRALSLSEAQLRALTAHLQAVREEERTQLAREIHDVLGQELTGLKMDASWVLRRLAGSTGVEAVTGRLEAMRARIDASMGTVRRIAIDLRPGVLDDLGLSAALEWQAQEFESRYGVKVHCTLPERELPPCRDIATALFRMCQELLTNVARHAEASRVELCLELHDGSLSMTVEDDGRGILPHQITAPGSLGLLGLRERARRLGGQVHIGQRKSGGTRVAIQIPLR